jgi:hypothetical protein
VSSLGVHWIGFIHPPLSFDPMAAAIEWLDAYGEGDIEAILEMYAEDVVHCGCGGMKTITSGEGFRAYWVDRLQRYPASALDNIQQRPDGGFVAYVTCAVVVNAKVVVNALLTFSTVGQIETLSCDAIQLGQLQA